MQFLFVLCITVPLVAGSLLNPGQYSEDEYYDIAFLIDHPHPHMGDTNYKPLFEGLQEYVNLFKFVGADGFDQHCGVKVPHNLKGRHCFAIWYCGNNNATLLFKDTPNDVSTISSMLQEPESFHSGWKTLDCIEKAATMFTEQNGDRPRIGNNERKTIVIGKQYTLGM